MWKKAGQSQRQLRGSSRVFLNQGLTHWSSLRTREQDEAFIELLKPSPFDQGVLALHILRPSTRDELAKVQVTLKVLHEQNHSTDTALLNSWGLEHHFCAQNWFETASPRFLIKFDRPKQVVQISDGQSRLAILFRNIDQCLNAIGAIDHRKFGVKS